MNENRRCSTLFHFAGAGRKVADMDRHVELVSDALQLMLPHVRPVAVAGPGVGGDEYLARLGVALGADSTPPGLDGPHRKDWYVFSGGRRWPSGAIPSTPQRTARL